MLDLDMSTTLYTVFIQEHLPKTCKAMYKGNLRCFHTIQMLFLCNSWIHFFLIETLYKLVHSVHCDWLYTVISCCVLSAVDLLHLKKHNISELTCLKKKRKNVKKLQKSLLNIKLLWCYCNDHWGCVVLKKTSHNFSWTLKKKTNKHMIGCLIVSLKYWHPNTCISNYRPCNVWLCHKLLYVQARIENIVWCDQNNASLENLALAFSYLSFINRNIKWLFNNCIHFLFL